MKSPPAGLDSITVVTLPNAELSTAVGTILSEVLVESGDLPTGDPQTYKLEFTKRQIQYLQFILESYKDFVLGEALKGPSADEAEYYRLVDELTKCGGDKDAIKDVLHSFGLVPDTKSKVTPRQSASLKKMYFRMVTSKGNLEIPLWDFPDALSKEYPSGWTVNEDYLVRTGDGNVKETEAKRILLLISGATRTALSAWLKDLPSVDELRKLGHANVSVGFFDWIQTRKESK